MEFHGLTLRKVVHRYPERLVLINVADAQSLHNVAVITLYAKFPEINEFQDLLDVELLALQLQLLGVLVVVIELDARSDKLVEKTSGVGLAHIVVIVNIVQRV